MANACEVRGHADSLITAVFLNSLNQLTDILASMERILLTPIPISYAAFIQEVAWVYCLLLPFQIYQLFGWLTIPATIIVTCILLGLVSCGQEIENPFGYDANGESGMRRVLDGR